MKMVMFAAAAALFISQFANAQKVYKCTDANGTVVFSQYECGKDAQEVADIPKGQSRPPEKPNSAIQAISDSVADSDCRRSAQRLHDDDAEQQIADNEDRIRNISNHQWVGSTAAQRQTMERIDEQEILTLRQTNETLRTRITESAKRVDRALANCDKLREEQQRTR